MEGPSILATRMHHQRKIRSDTSPEAECAPISLHLSSATAHLFSSFGAIARCPRCTPRAPPRSQISPRLTYVQLLRAEPTKKISSLGQRTQSWSFGQEIGPIFGIFIQHHQCLTMIQVMEVAGPLMFLRLRPATPMAKWCKMDGGFSGRSGLDQITLQTQNDSGAFAWEAQLGIAYDPHFPLLSEWDRKIQPTSGRAALLSSHWSQSWAEQASWDPRAPTWSATSVNNGQQWSNVSGPTQPHRPVLPIHWTISLLCHLNFWYLLMGPLCQESDSWHNCWRVRPRKRWETHWLIHHNAFQPVPRDVSWCPELPTSEWPVTNPGPGQLWLPRQRESHPQNPLDSMSRDAKNLNPYEIWKIERSKPKRGGFNMFQLWTYFKHEKKRRNIFPTIQQ